MRRGETHVSRSTPTPISATDTEDRVCRPFHARPTRGQSWAGRRAPISEGAVLERGQAQFWKTPSTIHDRRRRHECGNLTMPV